MNSGFMPRPRTHPTKRRSLWFGRTKLSRHSGKPKGVEHDPKDGPSLPIIIFRELTMDE